MAAQNETPRERFRRMSIKRVANAKRALRLIGNLSGRGYESTDAEVAFIFEELGKAHNAAKRQFHQRDRERQDTFAFPEDLNRREQAHEGAVAGE